MTAPGPRPRIRHRVIAYELRAGTETIVMNSTGEGFIAATGTIVRAGHMTAEVGSGGPEFIQDQLAQLVAEEPNT